MDGLRAVLLLCLGVACSGQAQPRVVETHGDGSETTCLAAADDVLWIGTRGAGLFRMTPDGSTRYDSTTGLHGNRVHDCVLAGGTVWVATEGALSRLDPEHDRFETIRVGRFTRLAPSDHGLWASGSDGGVIRIDTGDVAPTGGATGTGRIGDALPDLSALAPTPGGHFAAGSSDGRIYLSRDDRVLDVRPNPDAPPEPVTWLEWDDDRLLIGTDAGPLAFDGAAITRAPGAGRRARLLGRATPQQRAQLDALDVRAAAPLGERLAVATDEGLLLLDGGATERVQLGDMPCGDRITSLAVHDGALWAGSFDRGLCRLDVTPAGERWTHFAGPAFLPSDMVNDLASDGERLWVATASGVAWIEPDGRFVQRTSEDCRADTRAACPFHGAVNGVAVDAISGEAWVADLGAVHRAGTPDWRHYYRRAGIDSQSLTRIAARDGLVAVGSGDRGLYLKPRGRGARFDALDDQQGLADNWVMDLAFDGEGQLWVATCTAGLSVRDRAGAMRSLSVADGLPDDYTLSVNPIGEQVFVGTLRGLAVVDSKTDVIRTLDTGSGLSGHEVHDVVAHAGRIWVATDAGLSVLDQGAALQ